MSKRISEEAKAYLSKIGRKGGKASGKVKARTSTQARRAAQARWGNNGDKAKKQ